MLQGEHSAILSTFIKLLFVIKIFVLSIFEWPFKTGFAVLLKVPAMGTMRVLSMHRLLKIIPLLFDFAISSGHLLHFRDNVQVKPCT